MLPLRLLQSLQSPLYLCSKPALTLWPAASRLIFRQLEDDMMNIENDLERRMQGVYKAYPLVDMVMIRRAVQSRSLAEDESTSINKEENKNYELTLNISAFSPEELTVKTEGRRLIVSGKHDNRKEDENGGYFHEYREWRTEAELPEDVNPEDVLCSLSQDGRLRFQAPRRALPSTPQRSIPITVINNQVEGQQNPPEIKSDQPKGEQGEGSSCS